MPLEPIDARRSCGPTIDDGSIDTVIVAITDLQGRLQGKRLDAEYFLDDVARARHRGLQLPARGRRRDEHRRRLPISSWERGYGDFVMVPDLAHAAPHAVAARHRDGAGRRHGSTARRWSSRRGRSCAASSTGWPSAAGPRMVGTELEFIALRRQLRAGLGQALRRADARPTSTTSTTRSSAPAGSSRCCARSGSACATPACRSSRPRASATSASTRSRSSTPTR